MAIGAPGSIAASGNLQARTLGMEDFLKILLTQLTYQDPLKPVDNQQFMAQMAQFTALEQTRQLNSNLETLITNQASLQSVGLLGRTVDLLDEGAGKITGTVSALSLAGLTPTLSITSTTAGLLTDVALSRVTAVR